jgi:hypothetical protein
LGHRPGGRAWQGRLQTNAQELSRRRVLSRMLPFVLKERTPGANGEGAMVCATTAGPPPESSVTEDMRRKPLGLRERAGRKGD